MKSWILLLALPVSAAAQAVQVVPARPILLDEAVRLAQRNAPAAVSARGQMRTSAAQVRGAYAAFIPNVSLTASTGRTDGVAFFQGELVPRSGDPWNFRNGISASVDLFDGGRRFADLRRTRAVQDAAEANDIVQRFGVALDVKQEFFNVLAARESESAARSQLAQAEQQFRAANARVAAGVATKSDSLRAIIEVGNAQLAILTSLNNLNIANAGLTRLVGATELVTASSDDTLGQADLALDSAALVEIAQRAPSVLQAESDVAAARAAVRAARTEYLPSISASYSYGVNTTSGGFETGNLYLFGRDNPNSKQLSFSFNLPLFNQWQRETENVQASVAAANADASLRDAQLGSRQTLTQTLGAFRLAQQRIEIQLASVTAGEEDLRVQEERYRLGASTQLDVLTSQSLLNQARLALISARYDARVAKAQIEALIGREL